MQSLTKLCLYTKSRTKIKKKSLAITLAISLIGGIVFSLDHWTFGNIIDGIQSANEASLTVSGVIASVLYGGIIEEVMLRLFFMSLIAFVIWKLFCKKYGKENIPTSVFVIAKLADFIRQIESLEIPECTDWWFYSYDFTRFGIELDMCHCEKIVFESKDIYTMTVDETLTISEIQCNMITVSEFAELHGVQSVTVRKWIRRGKLRAIKKQGRDWLIASIAEKPSRQYKPVTYEWE